VCAEAGANLIVAGSAIYGESSPGDAYRAIVAAAGFA
jgi:pentose-5-phosphate-3-epimerase